MFDVNITEIGKSLSIMYSSLKMHKTPIIARFFVVSKNYSKKLLSDAISKISKMVFNTAEIFHDKASSIEAVRNSLLRKILLQLLQI